MYDYLEHPVTLYEIEEILGKPLFPPPGFETGWYRKETAIDDQVPEFSIQIKMFQK